MTTLLAAACCLAAVPGMAAAAETYTQSGTGCAAGSWGSGSSDENGVVYAACDAKIIRFAADGTKLADIVLPAATTDVAASPKGEYIYTFQSDTVVRLNRNVDGTYTKDANWKVGTFTFDGLTWNVRGRGIATDAWGDLYISNGGWYPGEADVVVKYSANGTFITAFGGWGLGPGEFNINMGLTVSRDGRTIYTTEQTNGRIQRFDYKGGKYVFTSVFGNVDSAHYDVNCVDPNYGLSAPYDLGLDPWGYVYVMDTSCNRVKKYSPTGQALGIVATNLKLAHGIAVGRSGEFYVGQWGQRFVRSAANPVPGPIPAIAPLPAADTVAPTLTAVTIPATTTTQTIAVGITATDNVAVTQVRIANQDGVWSAWQPFATTVNQTLTAGFGIKGITVQVADEAGNVSTTLYKTTSFQAVPPPPADAVAPTLTAITVPATTTTQTIAVGVTATDNTAVTQVRTANEDGTWSAWQAYAATINVTLTAGYGTKGVTVQVRDAAGNESTTLYKTTLFAATPPPPAANDIADPIITAVTIPTVTNNQTIAVTTTATDDTAVTRIRFANEDGNWTAWQAYADTKNWTLSAGYGPKLVFVQVGDAYWHESTIKQLRTSFQADVAQPPVGGGNGGGADAVAPTLTDAVVPATSTTQAITIAVTATDNVAVTQVRFANEDGNWAGWQNYTPNMNWTLSAGYTYKLVFIQVRDAAGNESTVMQKRSQLVLNAPVVGAPVDAAAPVLKTVTLPNPALTRTIDVAIDATDDIAVTQVRFANEDGTWGAWQAYAPTKSWTLTTGNLYKLVFVQVRDASGKESNVVMSKTLLQAPNNGA